MPYDIRKDKRAGCGPKGHNPLYVGGLLLAERSMKLSQKNLILGAAGDRSLVLELKMHLSVQ